MDTSNWRPTQGGSAGGGDSSLESGDWRSQLQADLRQRIVNKIMDTLKRHLPFSGPEGIQELRKIAVRFEEKIYTAATSQSYYLLWISLKMLTMETRSQNPMPDAVQSNSAANSVNPSDPGSQVMQQVNNQGQALPIPVPSNHPQPGQQQRPMPDASTNSTAQTDNANGGDWQEEVYQKIKAMKDLYLLDLNSVHQIVLGKLQQEAFLLQHYSLPQQPKNEQLEKLKVLISMLECVMAFLQIPKHNVMANYKDNLGTYEKQIQSVINLNWRKLAATQQQTQALPPPHLSSMQQSQQTHSQLTQVQPHESEMNSQMQMVNLQGSMAAMQRNNMGSLQQNSVSSVPGSSNAQQNMMGSMQLNSNLDPGQNASLDSTAQTRNANGGDWQEEVYQKIKAMRDLYLRDLNDMHQKILGRLQQHDSLPQQPKNEQVAKLKIFKNMLERFMAFLQIPKHNIMANYKDKLGTYEKQIQNVINSNWRKPAATQQQTQALPPPHLPSVQQSQQTQVQPHESQMNSQMQTVNLQGSMAAMQQNNMGSLQQNSVSSVPGSSNAQQNMMGTVQLNSNLDPGQNASLDSTAQTGNVNGGDWQEEVYQKIKAMKDLYLLDLNDMHQKILDKLQQHDSLPQQPKNEELEKLKFFKDMLERFMAFLQIPKHNVMAVYKDKLGTYEMQIQNIINSNRRKRAATQQQTRVHLQPYSNSNRRISN